MRSVVTRILIVATAVLGLVLAGAVTAAPGSAATTHSASAGNPGLGIGPGVSKHRGPGYGIGPGVSKHRPGLTAQQKAAAKKAAAKKAAAKKAAAKKAAAQRAAAKKRHP